MAFFAVSFLIHGKDCTKMIEKAYAKINLCLDVIRRREDGYHDLKMVMVPIDLYDTVLVEISPYDELVCEGMNIPMDETNTVFKAIQLLREKYGFEEHFRITIEKNIPMQAGMAGGSADGAAVLRMVNQMLQLHIPIDELSFMSKAIGADVPFCVKQQCSIVEGIGEYLTPFSMNCDFYVLLVKPEAGVPTGTAFQMLDFSKCEHPNCEDVKRACETDDFTLLCQSLGNTLEYSAVQIVKEVADLKQKLQAMGFPAVLMSGSGSTVFALSQDEAFVDQAVEKLKDEVPFVMKTRIKQ